MKYRRKTWKASEIEAFQFDGDMMTSDGKYYVPEWAVKALDGGILVFHDTGDLYIEDALSGQPCIVPVGDYIIRGIYGGVFTEMKNVFEETYELVEE